MKLQDLIEERTEKLAEVKGLDAQLRGGRLSEEGHAEVTAEFDEALAEVKKLDKKIEEAQSRKDAIAEAASVSFGNQNVDASESIGAVTTRERFEDDPKCGYANEKAVLNDLTQFIATGVASPQLQFLSAAGTDEHSAGNDPYGGYIMPKGFSNQILSVPSEENPLLPLFRQINMDALTVTFPAFNRFDHSESSSGSVTGGVKANRKSETAAASASRAKTEEVKLEGKELVVFQYATELMIKAAPAAVASFISQNAQEEIPSKIMRETIRGTGSGEMEGALNCDCKVEVTRTTALKTDGADVVSMRSRIHGYGNSVFLANHDTIPALVESHIPLTNGSQPLFVPGNGTDKPDTLLGRPIYFSEYASAVGNAGDLMLINPTQYLYGVMGGIDAAESIHFRFDRLEKAFRFYVVNDGKWWWRSALTPNQSTVTLSPVVTLSTKLS